LFYNILFTFSNVVVHLFEEERILCHGLKGERKKANFMNINLVKQTETAS